MPKLENVQITSYQLGVLDNNANPDGDSFVFQSRDSGDLVVTKSLDMTTTPLFDGHTGGANFVFCDGSVRTLDGQDDPNLLLPAVSDPKLLLPYTDFDIA